MYFSSVFVFTSILQMQRFSFWARGVHSFGVRWEGTEGVRYGLFCLPLDKPGCFGDHLAFLFSFFFWVGGSADVETSAAPFRREKERTIDVHVTCPQPASHPSPYPRPLTSPRESTALPGIIHTLLAFLPNPHRLSWTTATPWLALAAPPNWCARPWLAGWLAVALDQGRLTTALSSVGGAGLERLGSRVAVEGGRDGG
jgi:hypothetical protein